MVTRRILFLAFATLFLTAVLVQQAEGKMKMKKFLIASLIAKAIKPRFVPIPLPLPIPLKIKKDKVEHYPVYNHGMEYGGGGGGYGMGGMGGGYGMMGGMGGYD